MKIVVVGLGYVGCPLAYELSKHFTVVGYDINQSRVDELKAGIDRTNELSSEQVRSAKWWLSTNPSLLSDADVIIVTVPTPVTDANVPDLTPVEKSTETIGKYLRKGQTVVYESTVYPGVTEDICVPILEKHSGLKWKTDFFVGYSPERINPGDKVNTLTTVTKIVSGDTPATLARLVEVYGKVTKLHEAETIKVAEAAKVIENTQRDVNIALMNELSAIFSRLGIDTHDVIRAAGSKWNFLKFYPGLVGGHCISVDPYYLTHRAEEVGYIPSLILSAREVNDQMPNLIAYRTLQAMGRKGLICKHTVVTILGCTFKENVPDIRNSKVFKLIKDLQDWGVKVQVIDPHANPDEVEHEYGLRIYEGATEQADAVILAVAHSEFLEKGWDYVKSLLKTEAVVMDLKSVLDRGAVPDHVELVRV